MTRNRRSRVAFLLVAPAIIAVALIALAGAEEPEGNLTGSEIDTLSDVTPMPDDVLQSGKVEAEIADRVAAWADETQVDQMTSDQVENALLTIWDGAIPRLEEGPTWWLEFKELGARVHVLCDRLPADDSLRSDFCPA
jgi:hypothetical protein